MTHPTLRRPSMVTQRKTPPWDDCSLASGAMLADYATSGRIRLTAAQVRAESGVPDRPDASDPTTLEQMAHALSVLAPNVELDIRRDLTWPQFTDRLRAGAGAVLQGRNAALTPTLHRWDPAYMGGHAVFVMADAPGTLWWMDPEAPAAFPGESVREADVRRWALALTDGTHVYAALAQAPMQEEPMLNLAGFGTTSRKAVVLAPRTGLFEHPGDALPFARLAKESRVKAIGGAPGGWLCVVVSTAHDSPDGQKRPRGVYVRSAGLELVDA